MCDPDGTSGEFGIFRETTRGGARLARSVGAETKRGALGYKKNKRGLASLVSLVALSASWRIGSGSY